MFVCEAHNAYEGSRGGARSFEGLEPRSANPTGTGPRPLRQIGSALLSLSLSLSLSLFCETWATRVPVDRFFLL